jgi:hypothetical protein
MMNDGVTSESRQSEIDKFFKTSEWRKAQDAKGRTYYYRKGSSVTQWQKPEELLQLEAELEKKPASVTSVAIHPIQSEGFPLPGKNPELFRVKLSSALTTKNSKLPLKTAFENESEPEEENFTSSDWLPSSSSLSKNDIPSVQNEEQPNSVYEPSEETHFLSSLLLKDSILNLATVDNAKKLIDDYQKEPKDIFMTLTNGYTGFAQLSKIILEWSHFVSTICSTSSIPTIPDGSSKNCEEKFISLFVELLASRFNRKIADDQLLHFQGSHSGSMVPAWLQECFRNNQICQLLEQLAVTYPDSSFLTFCKAQILVHRSKIPSKENSIFENGFSFSECGFYVNILLIYNLLQVFHALLNCSC